MNKTNTLFFILDMGQTCRLKYLIKRRKITPLCSNAGVLKDYQLIMNMGGPNFLEPSFANIRELRGSSVEGVVHEINKKDLQKIVNTEEDYELVKLSIDVSGKKKTAHTLIYKTNEKKDIPPSKRYLKILIRAAKENNLSSTYIKSLEGKQVFIILCFRKFFSLRVYLWVWLRT